MVTPYNELTKDWSEGRKQRVKVKRDDLRYSLAEGEPHPSIIIAKKIFQYYQQNGFDFATYRGALSSCAIEGNRTAEILLGTLNRLEANEPVSDRYFMGFVLALLNRELVEMFDENIN
jgi:hypothetical protein